MKGKIDCFIPEITPELTQKTVSEFQKQEIVDTVFVLTRKKTPEKKQHKNVIAVKNFENPNAFIKICAHTQSDYALILFDDKISIGQFALERFVQFAETLNGGIVYSDFFREKEGALLKNPLIDYLPGSVRNDFDFGKLVLIKQSVLIEATGEINPEFTYSGWYDLRLRISQKNKIIRIPEFLYTLTSFDSRKSGEKQFDYLDPKNKIVQLEMEKVFTAYLKEINAFITPDFPTIDLHQASFKTEASVIIPVRNREKTILDAIKSVLRQQTNFTFNIIIVDNQSTDSKKGSKNRRLLEYWAFSFPVRKICRSARQRRPLQR